jgi:hypothetical protein
MRATVFGAATRFDYKFLCNNRVNSYIGEGFLYSAVGMKRKGIYCFSSPWRVWLKHEKIWVYRAYSFDEVSFIDRQNLIRSKKLSNRAQDKADLELLLSEE